MAKLHCFRWFINEIVKFRVSLYGFFSFILRSYLYEVKQIISSQYRTDSCSLLQHCDVAVITDGFEVATDIFSFFSIHNFDKLNDIYMYVKILCHLSLDTPQHGALKKHFVCRHSRQTRRNCQIRGRRCPALHHFVCVQTGLAWRNRECGWLCGTNRNAYYNRMLLAVYAPAEHGKILIVVLPQRLQYG